jgi:hypothetical protein
MSVTRYPNRVGQTGTYAAGPPGTVSLDAAGALDGYRTFADALTASKLIEGDVVGVLLREQTHPERWLIAPATYAAAALSLGETEDVSSTPPADAATVEIQCVVTDGMLRALDSGYVPIVVAPATWDGPAYFDIASSDTAWDAENGWYTHSSYTGSSALSLVPTAAGSAAGWDLGYRPTNLTLDVYVPLDASPDREFTQLRVYYGTEGDYVQGDSLGSSATPGEWVSLGCGNLASDLTGDIQSVRLVQIPGTMEEPGSLYRLRNLVFTESDA